MSSDRRNLGGDNLNGLDLFSGIGGINLALKPWIRTVAYCERDRYAQGVLLSRMRSGNIDQAPIWDDVQTLSGEMLGKIDIITGGFPCQDISVAGRGDGLEGKRSGLFFQIIRLTDELKPRFVFLENVPAIRTRGLDTVIKEFTRIGYDCRWTVVSAAEVGAPHIRKRWFLLAHSDGVRIRKQQGRVSRPDRKGSFIAELNGQKKYVAHSVRSGLQGQRIPGRGETKNPDVGLAGWWEVEPDVGRVVNGLQYRVDRIRCLGNSVVPIQVQTAFERLIRLG